jgi:eukaryotic-like serine/threonine-protein kinase
MHGYCAGVGRTGQLIAHRYELKTIIGKGAMGAVWCARDTMLKRDVAIKEVIFPSRVSAEEQRLLCARLIREAHAAARLSHPAVVIVHDVVEDTGLPWIVMEWFDGGSLQDLILSDGPLPYRRVAEIGLQVLDALCTAHSAGVVHRDVKPSNVLVNGSRVKLTDFGAASVRDHPTLTTPGLVIGTPAFMAPEHARGKPVPESDLWSLGATLYAAVEGRPPFSGGDNVTVLAAVLTSSPDPPRLAGPLEPVLRGLLRADPAERLTVERTASMLREVAAAPLNRTPIGTSAPGPRYTPTQPRTPRLQSAITLTGARRPPEAPHRPEMLPGTPAAAGTGAATYPERAGIRIERERRPQPRRAGQVDEQIRKTSRRWRIILPSLAGLVAVVIVIVVAMQTGVESYAPSRSIPYPSGVSVPDGVVALSPDGKMLAVGTGTPGGAGDGVYFWNVASGRYLGSVSVPSQAGVNAMAYSPDGTLLVGVTNNGLGYVWDVRTGSEISSFNGNQGSLNAVAFSPDGTVIAYSGTDGIIDLWDIKSQRQISTFGGSSETNATSLAFSPDGKELAVGYYDGSAQIWSTSTDHLLFDLDDQAALQNSPAGDCISEIAFSPDGRTLAGGDCDGSTYLWDPATGRQTATLTDPGSGNRTVSGIAFSGSGTTLATADYDQSTTYLWDVRTRQVTAMLSAPVLGVAASSGGSTLATIGNAGYAYLWSASRARS